MDVRLLAPTGDAVDPLTVCLISCDQFQFLPEFLQIFGREHLLKFLDIFSGQTIKIPPRELLERAILNVSIWRQYTACPSNETIEKIAEQYGLPDDKVADIIDDVDRIVKKLRLVTFVEGLDQHDKSCESGSNEETIPEESELSYLRGLLSGPEADAPENPRD